MKSRELIKVLAFSGLAATVAACASAPAPHSMEMQSEAATLWRQTCAHCHNLRPAPEFTAEQWSVIVTHMRTHGDLTRSEALAISEYLRSVRER